MNAALLQFLESALSLAKKQSRKNFSTGARRTIPRLVMRKIKPRFGWISVLTSLTLALLSGGCSKSGSDKQPEADSTKKAKSTYTLGMSQCNLGEPWRVQMNADVKAAADKRPEIKMVFKDAQNDTLKQRSHVEEFVSAGVDLIIISPKEAQPLTEPVAKAMAANIPVIVLDRSLLSTNYTCFIGADNKKIGKAAGA